MFLRDAPPKFDNLCCLCNFNFIPIVQNNMRNQNRNLRIETDFGSLYVLYKFS
jgi:hypothetical protein